MKRGAKITFIIEKLNKSDVIKKGIPIAKAKFINEVAYSTSSSPRNIRDIITMLEDLRRINKNIWK